MSMRKVAELAGVSVATVSRVVNSHPSITPATAKAVRAAMEKLDFRPSLGRSQSKASSTTTVGILMFGEGQQTAPAYNQLLQGISEAADSARLNLLFGFAANVTQLPQWVLREDVDGLLVGGVRPDAEMQSRLEGIPTVWLMGNRERPQWGDHVMPDNTAIGQIAASYLKERGHQHVMCMAIENSGWSIGVRTLAFIESAREREMSATLVHAAEEQHDGWSTEVLDECAGVFAEALVKAKPRPTGIFVCEDRLLASIDRALTARGIDTRPGGDVDVISCNNEREFWAGLRVRPASIDINPNSIGRRAVELLLTRIRTPQTTDGRIRLMIAPTLVPAEG